MAMDAATAERQATRLGHKARYWCDGLAGKQGMEDTVLARMDLSGDPDVLIGGWYLSSGTITAHRVDVGPSSGQLRPRCNIPVDTDWTLVPAAVVALFGRRCSRCPWPTVEDLKVDLDKEPA